MAESVIAGSTDFATVPQRTLLVMAAPKLSLKVISMNGWGTEVEVAVPTTDTFVESVAHLKGKTIGLGVGSEVVSCAPSHGSCPWCPGLRATFAAAGEPGYSLPYRKVWEGSGQP